MAATNVTSMIVFGINSGLSFYSFFSLSWFAVAIAAPWYQTKKFWFIENKNTEIVFQMAQSKFAVS